MFLIEQVAYFDSANYWKSSLESRAKDQDKEFYFILKTGRTCALL